MGTRNLTAVMIDGEYKVAQYAQWDGYPGGQGRTALAFLNNADLEKFKEQLSSVDWISEDEWKEIIDNHTDDGSIQFQSAHAKYWEENLAHLDRNIGAGILEAIRDDGVTKLKNGIAFAGDSLFCEWAYVIDFDKETFEVYEGFNKTKITEGRFLSSDESLSITDGYEPVRLVKEYKLSSLPSENDFLEQFKEEDE